MSYINTYADNITRYFKNKMVDSKDNLEEYKKMSELNNEFVVIKANLENVERENEKLKDKVTHLYSICVRTLVSIKYLSRVVAVIGAYYWLGKINAIALCSFLVFIALIQLGIDKLRQEIHPQLDISEWEI